jgi:pyridoxine 4-dehydrogenase
MANNLQSLGGTFQLADDIAVNRMGYGAMQLAGKGVFGPPEDHQKAIAVLREAVVTLGINHIDTSDFYGPHITNQLIKEALYPYPQSLHIVTKVGAKRDDTGAWLGASSADELRAAVHDNLNNLGLDSIDIVNLRIHGDQNHPVETLSISKPFSALAEMQKEGLIKHLGISTATAEQIKEAQSIAPIICVQNLYNISHRDDDELIDSLNSQGIAYVPYFPLGGFTPLQSEILIQVAVTLGTTPLAVALAWLLQRSPNILLIPGTSSIDHLHENISAASLELTDELVTKLNGIASQQTSN